MPYYNNRRGGKRGKNGWTKGNKNNNVAGAASIMLNPFTNLSVIPRIPDGLTAYSTGFREQVTAGITNITKTICIVIYPGFFSPFYYAQSTVDAPTEYTIGVDQLNWQNNLATKLFKFQTKSVETARIVSQGMSIKCTSNAQTNDGYFEAIRLSSASLTGEAVSLTALANNPTYVHGKIRDIESYSFQLKPAAQSDFQNLNKIKGVATTVQEMEVAGNDDTEEAEGGTAAPTVPTGATVIGWDGTPLTEAVDPAFDAILIKLTAGTSGATDIFMHSVTNFEVVYDESSEMAKFMTSAPKDLQAVERVKSTLTSNMKACRSIYHAR